MFKSRRRSAAPEVTVVGCKVYEGRYECGEYWFDAVDGAHAIQYVDAARSIIRDIPTEAEAIRRLLGR